MVTEPRVVLPTVEYETCKSGRSAAVVESLVTQETGSPSTDKMRCTSEVPSRCACCANLVTFNEIQPFPVKVVGGSQVCLSAWPSAPGSDQLPPLKARFQVALDSDQLVAIPAA